VLSVTGRYPQSMLSATTDPEAHGNLQDALAEVYHIGRSETRNTLLKTGTAYIFARALLRLGFWWRSL